MSSIRLQVQILFWLMASGSVQRNGNVENIALNKRYFQSSHHTKEKPWHAANGDTNGNFDNENCIHTLAGDEKPTWQVDLGQVYPVLNITIYGRTMVLFRLVNVSITVDGQPCYRIEKTPSRQSISLSCASTLYGQRVTLQKALTSSDPHENVLNICEVQIWVCRRGFYGDNCLILCGKCEDSLCDRYNGNCRFSRCQPGYHGNTCIDKCEVKKYGENCSLPCGHCANNATCHHVTGTCPDHCTPGYTGLTCHTGNTVEYIQLS